MSMCCPVFRRYWFRTVAMFWYCVTRTVIVFSQFFSMTRDFCKLSVWGSLCGVVTRSVFWRKFYITHSLAHTYMLRHKEQERTSSLFRHVALVTKKACSLMHWYKALPPRYVLVDICSWTGNATARTYHWVSDLSLLYDVWLCSYEMWQWIMYCGGTLFRRSKEQQVWMSSRQKLSCQFYSHNENWNR